MTVTCKFPRARAFFCLVPHATNETAALRGETDAPPRSYGRAVRGAPHACSAKAGLSQTRGPSAGGRSVLPQITTCLSCSACLFGKPLQWSIPLSTFKLEKQCFYFCILAKCKQRVDVVLSRTPRVEGSFSPASFFLHHIYRRREGRGGGRRALGGDCYAVGGPERAALPCPPDAPRPGHVADLPPEGVPSRSLSRSPPLFPAAFPKPPRSVPRGKWFQFSVWKEHTSHGRRCFPFTVMTPKEACPSCPHTPCSFASLQATQGCATQPLCGQGCRSGRALGKHLSVLGSWLALSHSPQQAPNSSYRSSGAASNRHPVDRSPASSPGGSGVQQGEVALFPNHGFAQGLSSLRLPADGGRTCVTEERRPTPGQRLRAE